MDQVLVSLWYVGPFFEWVGTKMTVVGLMQVCAVVSLLSPSYDCHDRRGEHCCTYFLCCRSDTSVILPQITLRGRVSPVGGIKEKVLGVRRGGANRAFPWGIGKDVEHDVAKECRARGARRSFWTWLVVVACTRCASAC